MNIYKTITIKTFLISALVTLLGCSDNNHEHKAGITGKELYKEHCAACHKANGEGKFLKGVPPNKYTNLTTEQLIERIINNSDNKTKMKIFKSMSKQEAQSIALYVKSTLKKQ